MNYESAIVNNIEHFLNESHSNKTNQIHITVFGRYFCVIQ